MAVSHDEIWGCAMKWTEQMKELLRDSYRARGAEWCAAMLGGVSAQAVRAQARQLGIFARPEPAAFTSWTAAEVDLLRAEYRARGAEWCAAQLGRSVKAVEMHVSRLGISKRGAERKTPPGKPLNGATRRKRKAVAMAVATHPQNAPGAQIDGKNGAQDECGDCERRCKRSLTCPREVDAASNCGR